LKKWPFLRTPRLSSLSNLRLPSLSKLRFSRKKVGWGLTGTVVCILIYLLGIHPAVEATRNAETEIAQKKKVLLKFEEYLRNRKAVEEELDRATKRYEGIQQRLLPGDTPQLGAANLQEIIKQLSEKNGIIIRSFKILEPKEIDAFRKVSLQIDFNPTNSMLGLGQFMYDVEHHEKDLMISEMDLLVPNMRMPNNIQGNMVVSGLMKGTKTKEKGKEKEKEKGRKGR
jgi:hypothetical protein